MHFVVRSKISQVGILVGTYVCFMVSVNAEVDGRGGKDELNSGYWLT